MAKKQKANKRVLTYFRLDELYAQVGLEFQTDEYHFGEDVFPPGDGNLCLRHASNVAEEITGFVESNEDAYEKATMNKLSKLADIISDLILAHDGTAHGPLYIAIFADPN